MSLLWSGFRACTNQGTPGLTGRVDFSKLIVPIGRVCTNPALHTGIDIFSPRLAWSTRGKSVILINEIFRLDISHSSVHAKRRIWQEAIATIFLTAPSCKIPKEQRMSYAESPRDEYAPYLLNFLGSPGERHAENVKVRPTCQRFTSGT